MVLCKSDDIVDSMTRNVIKITGRTVYRYVQSLILKNVVFILAIAHENAVAHAQSPILKNAVFILSIAVA